MNSIIPPILQKWRKNQWDEKWVFYFPLQSCFMHSHMQSPHALAFKLNRKIGKPWHSFPSISDLGIIKDEYPIGWTYSNGREIEKVSPNKTRFKDAFNGLSLNVDDAETVTLIYKLICIPIWLRYLVLVFPLEFVVLFAWF